MDFQFIQELADCLAGIEIHLVPQTQEGAMHLLHQVFQGVIPTEQAHRSLLRTVRSIAPGTIYELSSVLDLHFAVFCREETGQLLVLGPCRQGQKSPHEIAAYLRNRHVPEHNIRTLLSICSQQPLVSYETLHRLAALLARKMMDIPGPIPFQQLDYHWLEEEENQDLLETSSFQEFDDIRRVENRYQASAILTEAVKQGNLSLAYRFIQKMNAIPNDMVRNPDSLRNSQNLCIVLNTQLRHAMEETGIPPYQLDQLSGAIGRHIEKLRTVAATQQYTSQIIRQYCELAQQWDQSQLPPLSRLAVAYIKSHLSDNLTVKDTARALLVNPDYLSAQFHKEVGITFICYVNRERVRQAAGLLQRTELQVQQIASIVGYNNTSYFARQFSQFMGMTPQIYRKFREK